MKICYVCLFTITLAHPGKTLIILHRWTQEHHRSVYMLKSLQAVDVARFVGDADVRKMSVWCVNDVYISSIHTHNVWHSAVTLDKMSCHGMWKGLMSNSQKTPGYNFTTTVVSAHCWLTASVLLGEAGQLRLSHFIVVVTVSDVNPCPCP